MIGEENKQPSRLFGNAKVARDAIQHAAKIILEGIVNDTLPGTVELTNDLVHRQALQEASISCVINSFSPQETYQVRELINSYFFALKYRDIKIVLAK
jgi:hypothetical protein